MAYYDSSYFAEHLLIFFVLLGCSIVRLLHLPLVHDPDRLQKEPTCA